MSRISLEDHITVNPLVLAEIERCFAQITIDRFATNMNKVVPLYNSYYLE